MILSVIIPGYNTPSEWWIRCVSSVIKATSELVIDPKKKTAEIICIDDGSNKIPIPSYLLLISKIENENLLKFLSYSIDIKIIRLNENHGQAEARNKALDIATGEYVTFVDSDDEVRQETYRLCVNKLISTNADVCLYGVTPIWTCEGLLKHDIPQEMNTCIPSAELVEKWYKDCLLNYVSNKVIKKSALFVHNKPLRFDLNGMPCEDIIFYLELLIANTKWCAINYDGYIYYRNTNTSVSYYKSSHHYGTLKCADTWKRFCQSRNDGFTYCGYHSQISPLEMASSDRKNLLGKGSPLWYAKLYQLFRSIFYIRPIRKWHLKRTFSNIEEYK